MKSRSFLALFFLVSAVAGAPSALAESLLDKASEAVKAVGDAAGKVTDAVGEKIDSSTKGLTDEATPELTRAKLDAMVEATLARLFADQPESRSLFDRSAGHAVFDAREASFYVVAGYGRGVAVDAATKDRVYMKMATAGAGLSLGIGGFESQLVILFEDSAGFKSFIEQGLDATAQIGAMAGEEKEEFSMRFNEGKAVFVLTKKGWKVAAKLTGSRYWPDEELNAI